MNTLMKPACLLLFLIVTQVRAAVIPLAIGADPAPRVQYGVERLAEALRAAGHEPRISRTDAAANVRGTQIVIGTAQRADVQRLLATARLELPTGDKAREAYALAGAEGGTLAIAGGDDSGVLYGCLDLARRIRETGRLPATALRVLEQPAFVLRGPCIGMQKTFIIPGRRVYEYPYTPELFPFFYDRAFWTEYLDFLAENRMNTLYLWNGHPFGSLVKLADYPDAVEVPPDVFARNVEMYRYLTQECEKRGIWLVQMFYNIFLPKPLAEKHGVGTQQSRSTPLAADYTRKAIAEFVKQYPNVGLMPTLGEALQGTPNQIEWATKTILPGVLDGMKAAGLTRQPPVVFRTHAMDPVAIMPEAFKVYDNLFTETKYNGESLTTWEPRGKSQETHLAMAKLGPHLVNVHILSNLEPFRYGAQRFIQKSILASRDRLGATGLHLYPLAYWAWPNSPDKTPGGGRDLPQIKRDWIWFEAWARYAWNPDREPAADRSHWIDRIAAHYGSPEVAALILDAYNDAGEVSPRIIRRYGITEGNRQTMALGMMLDQLVNPEKYGVFVDLYESQAPPGERLQEFVAKEVKGAPHVGETPLTINREIIDFSTQAVAALDRAALLVTKNREEFARLHNDIVCIHAMALSYAAKGDAARHVLRFRLTNDVADMDKAREFLAQSLLHFRTLERLTRDTYHFANTMQTAQRRIPVVGGVGGQPANYHWSQVLPVYEKELADFTARVAALKQGGEAGQRARALATIQPVPFTVHTPGAESFTLRSGSTVFSDERHVIESLATELEGIRGIRFPNAPVKAGRAPALEFSAAVPVRVLIGYVKSDSPEWRKPPSSEVDAAAAERGGTEPLLIDAARISSLPRVDIYELSYPAGRHKIEPTGTGSFLVLGVVAPRPGQP